MNILKLLLSPIRFLLWLFKKQEHPYPDQMKQNRRDEFIESIKKHNK